METTVFQPIQDEADPRVAAFLEAWHENGREFFERHYPNLDYDTESYCKVAHARRKYVCLDEGTGGVMMVEKANGQVFGIKAYGRIHWGHFCGHLEVMTADYLKATEDNRMIRQG